MKNEVMQATSEKGQETNQTILKERLNLFNIHEGARVGDYIKLPYGLFTRITHVHADSVQTGGGQTGYYLGAGYISYSGGLEPGIRKEDILLTDETKDGSIWFFSNDHHRAGNGVNFVAPFRVFEIKEGSDTSGIWAIKEEEKRQFLLTCETVTRVNGNGQKYTLPVPNIIIKCGNINDTALKHIEENTGLILKPHFYGYEVQPTRNEQITALFGTYNFKSTYYDNSTHSNTLILEFNNKD